jgi:tetratricopeptide (TPR) repeat protein
MQPARLLVPLLAALLLWATRPALADDVDRAREHFQQAEAYFRAGTYDRAIAEYQAAYDLSPHSALLFNIGLAHEQLGELDQAIAYYERYLAQDPDGVKAAEARARREALTRTLAESQEHEAKRARAAELRTQAAELSAAGDHAGAIAALSEARAIDADPELVFELAEAHRGAGETVLALTEYRRYLAAATTGAHRSEAARRIDELEAERARRPAPGGDANPAGGVQAAPPPATRRSLVPALFGYGGAVVFGTVGIIYGSRSRSTLDDLDADLTGASPPLVNDDPRFDDGRGQARNANIAFALAGVSLAAGAALTAWTPRPASDRSSARASPAPRSR